MILSGIARRYAAALFNVALKEGVAEQVSGDINSFRELFEMDADFRSFMGSPQVLTDDKKSLITNTFGERASGLFVKFLMLLIDKKRIMFIDEIAGSYTQLYEHHQGIVAVRSVTAVEMSHDMQTLTRQTLEQKLGTTVRLTSTVDPRIIGGMVLIVEDKIIDGSIRHQLDEIRKSLGELKVH